MLGIKKYFSNLYFFFLSFEVLDVDFFIFFKSWYNFRSLLILTFEGLINVKAMSPSNYSCYALSPCSKHSYRYCINIEFIN